MSLPAALCSCVCVCVCVSDACVPKQGVHMAVANLCPARHLAEVLPVHSPMHTGVCVSVRCCR